MYGRSSISILEGVVELRTRLLLAYDYKRNIPRFFVEVDQRPGMQMVDSGG
jgi:hypothetical protein